MRARPLACLCVLLLLVFASTSAPATTIISGASASDLAGATVTVTRFGGGMNSATFVLAAGGGAEAVAVGSAGFTLTVSPGDTALATWTLTNTDPSIILFNRITAVSIDLTLSGLSLFDDDSVPSTPLSGDGVLGVVHTGGIAISASSELNAWSDPANLGDMYTAVSITFGAGFTAGAASSWSDDTDLIPEPGTGVLFAAGLVALGVKRRRA